MKSKLTILAGLAMILGACTTGSYVTSPYSDDIYFNPGDVPPPITVDKTQATKEKPVQEKSGERMIISHIQGNEDGSNTMNNYIFDATKDDADALSYDMDQMDLQGSDTTTYYNDDEVKYVINNYYDGNDLDYAYRIRRFHDPFFYDPFYWDNWYYDPWYYGYSSWYYPGWSFAWNWGYPYSGWYSPYSWGWGWGYSPYYSYWGSPYYGGWGYPYYSYGYGGYGGYYGNYWNTYANHYRYGKRRGSGTNVVRNDNSGRRSTSGMVINPQARNNKNGEIRTDSRVANSVSNRRNSSTSGVRDARSVTKSANTNAVLTERRRTSSSSQNNLTRTSNAVRSNTNTNSNAHIQTYTRPGNSSRRIEYTRPATNYTKPRVVTKSSSRTTSRYAAPRSTSSYNRTYRSTSTYNRSSSGRSSSSRSYRAPSSNSRSSYHSSSPVRSRSSSSSFRSSGYSGSSSSYSSGSSGGSYRSSSSSSSSGRRR